MEQHLNAHGNYQAKTSVGDILKKTKEKPPCIHIYIYIYIYIHDWRVLLGPDNKKRVGIQGRIKGVACGVRG